MFILEYILIGISLSMDAFCLSIGAKKMIKRKYDTLYGICVGIFHFFMPILGLSTKRLVDNIFFISNNSLFVIVIIFIIIGLVVDKDDKPLKIILNPLLFSLAVSIDSYSIGLSVNKDEILVAAIIFSITSFIFTVFGLKLGNKIYNNFKLKGKTISIIILLLVLIYKVCFSVKS